MTEAGENFRQAKQSALMVGAVFLLIAAWNVWKDRPLVYGLAGACGLLLILTGLLSPAGSRIFHQGWMRFAGVLGYVNSRILLSLMFYLVFTPYGLVMRLFGRDTMNRRGAGKQSYWIPRAKTRQTRPRYERLF